MSKNRSVVCVCGDTDRLGLLAGNRRCCGRGRRGWICPVLWDLRLWGGALLHLGSEWETRTLKATLPGLCLPKQNAGPSWKVVVSGQWAQTSLTLGGFFGLVSLQVRPCYVVSSSMLVDSRPQEPSREASSRLFSLQPSTQEKRKCSQLTGQRMRSLC